MGHETPAFNRDPTFIGDPVFIKTLALSPVTKFTTGFFFLPALC